MSLAPLDTWLSDVAILNESTSFPIPGNVDVYRTIEDLCDHLEHWFVEEKLGYALTGTGHPIELTTDGQRVFARVLDDQEPSLETLVHWLLSCADAVREARLHKSKKRASILFSPPKIGLAEMEGALPKTVEGLLAYISMK